jgi:4-diphosphocytidyl-2-C-methyl-D-erythritol kinase
MATDRTGASEPAKAKINLALHVCGRREDGYRLIESLVVFAEFGDTVTATPAAHGPLRLTVMGRFAGTLRDASEPDDNLAVRAAMALLAATGREAAPTRLTLTKRLPIAAGLGGGSADAAAVLRLLDRQWSLRLSAARLAKIGLGLGADVPMCLLSRPLTARGIGEQVAPVAGMPALPMVLACPPAKVSTAAVFAALDGRARRGLPAPPAALATPDALASWLQRTRNDLGKAAEAVSGQAGAAARALAGDPECLFARMSGSGATAFGIFASPAAAKRAAARLRAKRPRWWVVPTITGAS